jgi:O-antigen biosynthesis protein
MAKRPGNAVAMLKRKASVPVVTEREILGFLDRIDEAGFGGWAVDFARPSKSLRIRILIDEVIVDVINCDLHRDDAVLLKLPTHRIGFYYNIPPRYHDGLRHVVKFGTLDGVPIMMSSRTGAALAELHFCLAKPVRVEGAVDGMINGLIQVWALNVDDHAKTKLGGVRVLVTTGGQPVAELLADQYRAHRPSGARRCAALPSRHCLSCAAASGRNFAFLPCRGATSCKAVHWRSSIRRTASATGLPP